MPVTAQYYYLMEAFTGAIEFDSPYMVMDDLKRDWKKRTTLSSISLWNS